MSKIEGATVTTKVLYGASALAAAAVPATYQHTVEKVAEHTAGRAYSTQHGTELSMAYDERLIDSKLEAVEARTETKFAQLLGKLDLMAAGINDLKGQVGELDTKIETVDGHTRSAKATIIGTIIGTGIAVAALAWGGVQIYQGGMGTSSDAFQAGIAAAEAKKQQ